MDGAGMIKKASNIFERDKSDPYTILEVDRSLNAAAIALPLITLAIAMFLGGDMYNVDGLAVFNPNRIGRGTHFETWNQMPFIRRHCWSQLSNSQCQLKTPRSEVNSELCQDLTLLHYSTVPYFLFATFILMYTAKALWNIGKATEMANKVNYLIGGVEEAVRDTLEYLLTSVENKSNSETTLAAEVILKAKKKEKYIVLNAMMKDFSTQQNFTTFYTLIRLYFVLIIIIVMIGTWFLYLDPSRNPISFECPLPEWLYYKDIVDNKTEIFKTVHAVFEPVARRTLLMFIMFGIYGFLLIVSVVGWLNADSRNHGIELIKKMPSLESFEKNGFNDLRYLMKLVYTNRKRVKFLRLAFDTMIATQRKGDSKESENNRFFSALREIAIWSKTDESEKQLKKIITRQIENISAAEE